jgi:hypothetical protein
MAVDFRKFELVEINYKVPNNKRLAIVDFFKGWKCYLEGPRFPMIVFRDNWNLEYITITKDLNQR